MPEEFRKILSRRVSEFETRIFENNEKLASLMEENEILKTTKSQTKTTTDALASENSLTSHLNLFRDLLEEKDEELEKLEKRLEKSKNVKNILHESSSKRLNSQLTLFRELLEEKDDELDRKDESLKKMTRKFEKMHGMIEKLESSLCSSKSSVAELLKKAFEMETFQAKQSEKESKKIESLKELIILKEARIEKLKSENMTLAKELKSAQLQNRECTEKLNKSEKNLREIKEENYRASEKFRKVTEKNEETIRSLEDANEKLKSQEIVENQLYSNQLESMKLKMGKLQERYKNTKSSSINRVCDQQLIPILLKEGDESDKHLMKEKILEKFKFERERRLLAEKEMKTCKEKKIQYEIFCSR